MMTLHQLFKINNLNPEKIKLVRHSNAEISVFETFKNNIKKFETYQSFQIRGKFKKAKYIAVFSPGRGTTAIFLGIWEVGESVLSEYFSEEIHSLIDEYNFPKEWHNEDNEYYELKLCNTLKDLSERLIIEWGKAIVAWVQNKDKEIIEIKRKGNVLDFISYDEVQLKYEELVDIIKNSESNYTWYSALSAVNGIYLIKDFSSGKLYVGSAYGEKGIWGRWETYVKNGHGGNKELITKDPKMFEFSILEIVSSTVSLDSVIERENRWKEKLGSREFGLNSN